MLHQTMGRFDEAISEETISCCCTGIEGNKYYKGKKSFESRQFLSNQASVLQVAGKYEDAEKTYLSIKTIYENKLQKGSPEMLTY